MSQERATAIVGDLEESGTGATRFWLAIGSNILHSIDREVLIAAFKGWLAQFVFPLLPGMLLTYAASRSSAVELWWPWIAALVILAAQILTGYWLTRQREKRPILICLLVVIADCVVGLLKGNNASINMAIWAIPLLLTTVAIARRRKATA